MNQHKPGDVLHPHDLTDIHGKPVRIPDAERLVHLQFRRYAGCPVCNLHLRSLAARHDEIVAGGISEVAVFHSRPETMLEFQGQLPFRVIADPERRLYAEFGVGMMSPLVALDPRSWRAAGRAISRAPSLRGARGRGEQHLGQPADFLIAPDGRILAVKYGQRVDDHWSVDDLLDLAGSRPVGG
ncbi:MAG TPA: peroxiredoxin-like family protein [Streptosporangiaceae bacterium]|nr:peroxiredoxin-like family protein [Streptosporangiaceae bacterium]